MFDSFILHGDAIWHATDPTSALLLIEAGARPSDTNNPLNKCVSLEMTKMLIAGGADIDGIRDTNCV